jgi:uncharacterized protein
MLRVDIRQLEDGPVQTTGQLAPNDPALDGLGLALTGPVVVDGELRVTGGEAFLWRGRIEATVAGECVRCLTPLTQHLDEAVDVVFSSDPDLVDDPSVYALSPDATSIDVSEAVREELALRVSAFPLCRPDCQGLCATCGADLNAGPCPVHGARLD